MVQAPDAIGRVDALDRQHGRQDLHLGNGGRIAREQRFDEERFVSLDDELHAVSRYVDTWHLVDDFVHLSDDDAVLEGSGLYDGRRVLGVRPRIEISITVRADRSNQRDIRREVDEVTSKQLEIGMNRPEFDLAAKQHRRDARRLRAGIRKVEPLRHAVVVQVEVFRQHDPGLHHVQIAHLRKIDSKKR